jgi:DNA polymerase-3 subunit delta'
VSEGEADVSPPHPRESEAWFGHEQAEQALLDAYRGGRMPHAWLIGGPPGVGKATLAYRTARFVLAHPDSSSPDVQSARSLALPPDHRIARLVAAQGHPDLLVLERRADEEGKVPTVIPVERMRKLVTFLGSTPREAGWRVVVVDSADELNPQGANTMLKLLEEPPRRALILIISHAPGRLLATIRSRCRRLPLRPLAPDNVARAVSAALGGDADAAAVQKAAAASEGSVARAIALMGGPLLALRERVIELLDRLPATDPRALHALAESLERADRLVVETFVDAVRDWLSARLSGDVSQADTAATGGRSGRGHRLNRLAQAWENINRAWLDAQTYNLERKPLVFKVFGWLAEAARG